MSRMNKKKKEPELLPGAVLEEDCQTAMPVDPIPVVQTEDNDPDDDHEHDVTWTAVPDNADTVGNGLAGWQRKPAPWAVWLERLTLWLERPFNKLTGTPPTQSLLPHRHDCCFSYAGCGTHRILYLPLL